MTETPDAAMLLATGGYTTGRGTHREVIDPFTTAPDQRPLSAPCRQKPEGAVWNL